MEHKLSKTMLDSEQARLARSYSMLGICLGFIAQTDLNSISGFTSPRAQQVVWGSATSPTVVIRKLLSYLNHDDVNMYPALRIPEDTDLRWSDEAWFSDQPSGESIPGKLCDQFDVPHQVCSLALTKISHCGHMESWFSALLFLCEELNRVSNFLSVGPIVCEETLPAIRRELGLLLGVANLSDMAFDTFYKVQGWRSYKNSRQSDAGATCYRDVWEERDSIFESQSDLWRSFPSQYESHKMQVTFLRRTTLNVLRGLAVRLLVQVAGSVYVEADSEADRRFSAFSVALYQFATTRYFHTLPVADL